MNKNNIQTISGLHYTLSSVLSLVTDSEVRLMAMDVNNNVHTVKITDYRFMVVTENGEDKIVMALVPEGITPPTL